MNPQIQLMERAIEEFEKLDERGLVSTLIWKEQFVEGFVAFFKNVKRGNLKDYLHYNQYEDNGIRLRNAELGWDIGFGFMIEQTQVAIVQTMIHKAGNEKARNAEFN